jgi:hypothetical protein
MAFEYPKNYYALRRILTNKIREKINSYPDGSMTEEALFKDLQSYAIELSNESGASIKTVQKLFVQLGVQLK